MLLMSYIVQIFVELFFSPSVPFVCFLRILLKYIFTYGWQCIPRVLFIAVKSCIDTYCSDPICDRKIDY